MNKRFGGICRSLHDFDADSIDELAHWFGDRRYRIGTTKCPTEAIGNAGGLAHRT